MYQERFPFYLCAGILLASVSVAFGNEPLASVNRSEVRVADPFHLTVSVNVTEGTKVQFPTVPTSMGLFQVISHQDLFDVPIETGRSWTRIMELETYDSGTLEVPSIQIVVGNETKSTKPLSVSVQSLLDGTADVTQFRALKEVEEIPVELNMRTIWTTAVAFLGFLLIATLCFFVWKQKAAVSSKDWAFAQLDQLEKTQAYKDSDQAVVLPQAANILREFIQRQFNIAATKQTTNEFLQGVQKHPALSVQQGTELKSFLQLADEIKFSHFVPEVDRLHESFARIRSFIEGRSTVPVAKVAVAEPVAIPVAQVAESDSTRTGDDRFKPRSRGGTDGVAH